MNATVAMEVEEDDGGRGKDRDGPRDFGLCTRGVSESCQVVGRAAYLEQSHGTGFLFRRSLCVVDVEDRECREALLQEFLVRCSHARGWWLVQPR